MVHSVSRLPITAEARFQSHVIYCEICGEVALGQVILPVLRFCSVSIMPPMSHTHLYLHFALRWDPSKSNALAGIRDHMIKKIHSILFMFQVGRAVARTPTFQRRGLVSIASQSM